MAFLNGTDPNELFKTGPGEMPFDENVITRAHQLWLWSNNALIYPGQFTISGTWAPGDTAMCSVNWGANNRSFIYTVQQEDDAEDIARALSQKMAVDPVFIAVTMGVNHPSQYAGGWSWQINPQYSPCWTSQPRINLGATQQSAAGKCSVTLQVANVLDTPGATLVLGHSVADRPGQREDLVGEVTFYGQTDQPTADNLQQIFARLQVYIKQPTAGAPIGRWQWQNASANQNAVINAMMLADGLLLCDENGQHPAGGSTGDGFMGAGTINLPLGGGIYRDGVKIL
jgi:hypothetical protein